MRFEFRRLREADLAMLHGWLNEPGIVRWWEGDDVSWEAVQRDYSPTSGPDEHWIVSLDGDGLDRVGIGWIGCFAVADFAEEDEVRNWRELGIDPDAGGIDYLLADPAARGRGVGSAMVRAFTREIAFGRHPGWTQVCASPYVGNVASWRALEKAGFDFVGDFPADGGVCRLMCAGRSDPRWG